MSSNRGMGELKKGEWMRGQYSRRLRLFIEFSLVYKACIFSCFASKRRKNAQILVIAMEKLMHLLPRHLRTRVLFNSSRSPNSRGFYHSWKKEKNAQTFSVDF